MREFSDAQLKHLEFIQAVIARQASNSFLLKGWALTVAGIFYGFSAYHLSWRVAVVGSVAIFAFWYLDAFFVRQERLFRCLYNDAIGESPAAPILSLSTKPFLGDSNVKWAAILFSQTLWVYYACIVVVGAGLVAFGAVHAVSAH